MRKSSPRLVVAQFASGQENSDGETASCRVLNRGIGVCSPFFFCDARRTPAIVGILGSSCPGHNEEADPAYRCPEEPSQPPCESQNQSRSASQSESLTNQHISALVGSKVSWVDAANHIHQFGHRLDDQGAQDAKLYSHEPENQTNLDHSHAMRCQDQEEAAPKCSGRIVVEIQECILYGLNQAVLAFHPPLKEERARKKPLTPRNDGPALPHRQQHHKQEKDER